MQYFTYNFLRFECIFYCTWQVTCTRQAALYNRVAAGEGLFYFLKLHLLFKKLDSQWYLKCFFQCSHYYMGNILAFLLNKLICEWHSLLAFCVINRRLHMYTCIFLGFRFPFVFTLRLQTFMRTYYICFYI